MNWLYNKIGKTWLKLLKIRGWFGRAEHKRVTRPKPGKTEK
jgi:hypothetical protein